MVHFEHNIFKTKQMYVFDLVIYMPLETETSNAVRGFLFCHSLDDCY